MANRCTVYFLLFFGLFVSYLLRVAFNASIKPMTETRFTTLNKSNKINPDVQWSVWQQELVINAFFYGYIFTHIPGGYLTYLYGGKCIFMSSIGVTSLLTLVTPVCAKLCVYAAVLFRILMGVAQGLLFPAFYVISTKWGPPLQRGLLVTTALSGSFLGIIVGLPVADEISKAIGWEFIFYIFGGVGALFCIVGYFLLGESPVNDKNITKEKEVQRKTLTHLKPATKPPLGSIFLSLSVWALVTCYFAYSLGVYTILTELGYLNEYEISYSYGSNYEYTLYLPYIIMVVGAAPIGFFSDFLIKKRTSDTTCIRKVFICLFLFIQTIAIILACIWTSRLGSLVCMLVVIGVGVFVWSAISVNHYDICPQYACITIGLCNTFATIPIVLCPLMIENMPFLGLNINTWKLKFFLGAFFYIFAFILFMVFGSGREQQWIVTHRIPKSKDKPLLSIEKDTDCGWKLWKKRRYVVAFLAFLGFINLYTLRVNLSVAIVAMTEIKTVASTNGTTIFKQDFNWSSKTQGWILGSFFYGYITTQLLGGWLASRIGGKRVFGFGIGITSLLTIITPVLAKTSVYLLLSIRIVEGIVSGVSYPSILAVWAMWAPPLERSRLATFTFSGSYVGTVVSMPICGFLASTIGWESIFYIFGVIGLIWWLCWCIIVKDSPLNDPSIKEDELKYLKETLGLLNEENTRIRHPWKKILTSAPVWAIVVSFFGENWGFYTMLTQLPTFMKDALKFDLEGAGSMSALPYLAMFLFTQVSGPLADKLQEKKILTTTQVRKIFNCGAFIFQAAFMIGSAYWLTPFGSIFCITMAVGLGAFAWTGFSVNPLDIAPQHASVIMGIGNTIATLPGIISPIITGYIVTNKNISEWRMVFFIAAGCYIIGCLVYGICASGKLQPWAMNQSGAN